MQTWHSTTESSHATELLAAHMGKRLRGGEVIELISDLGGGKTTFTRGLVRGFGSTDKVSSPTFTISQEYRAGKRTLYHFDFYRLSEPGIMADELAEALQDEHGVSVIEWGDIVARILPAKRITLRLVATGEQTRELVWTYPAELEYAIPKDANI